MKALLLLIGIVFISFSITAQSQPPQAFNYQGIARDISGTPLVNRTIALQISILQGPFPGTQVYRETHTVQTNKLGVFTLSIGQGDPQNGFFTEINWAYGEHYIKTEIDPNGGNNFTLLGTSPLLSVPYALFAENGTGGYNNWQRHASLGLFLPTGNVGIGTNMPTEKLTIKGNDGDGDDRNYLSLSNTSTGNRSLVWMQLSAGNTISATSLQHAAETYDFEGDKYTDFGILASSGKGLILRADDSDGMIKFLAGGTPQSTAERMRITSDGNVGIGTEDPENLLTLEGNVGTGDGRFFASVHNQSLSNRSFSAMKFSAGGGSSFTSIGHNAETYDFDNFNTADFGGVSSNGAGVHLTAFRVDGIIKFLTSVNGSGAPIERMRISSDGNLGIGTIDPVSRVQVSAGDVYIEDINNGVIMKSPNGNCWRMTMNNDGSIKTTAITCPN